ncbi:MAG: DUF1512 domain-containing protein [Promethearchaeota archaeon]
MSYILNLAFLVLIFVSMFYGQRIQAYRSLKSIEAALEKLKRWNRRCKDLVIAKIQALNPTTPKEIEERLEEFMTFVAIPPTSLDPAGIVEKLDHVVDVRDDRFEEQVEELAPEGDPVQKKNLENLLEAGMAVDQVYRVLRHFYILGKKTKSLVVLMQVEMQLGLIMALAKSYKKAAQAFSDGTPIGDSLGPMVAASFVRAVVKGDPSDVEVHEADKDTIYQEVTFEGRRVLVVRAKGPGGSVGKPGRVIKRLVEKYADSLERVIMVDAGLKMEGDKTGSIAVGVGAAIGGVGVEKFRIEESVTRRKVPIDAIICRQSLEDAITTMKKPIAQSVPLIVKKVLESIRKRTGPKATVIVAGIGNTMGVGI